MLREGDEIMAKVIEVVHRVADDFEKRFYYNEEEVKRLEFEAGMEQGIIQTAKNMLKMNCNVEFISKITNLSIEDIQKLRGCWETK